MDILNLQLEECYLGKIRMDIPTLKPDHISLGKCAACHQFIHRYSSVNNLDIVELLSTGCKYNGFKKDVPIESEEEESFANMHHVLLLSSLDELQTKELCVQRINDFNVTADQLNNENFVVSDNTSVVILISNMDTSKINVHYFGQPDYSYIKLDYNKRDFNAVLENKVLFLTFDDNITFVNFNNEVPCTKSIDIDPHTNIIAMSSIMLVTSKEIDVTPVLHCEHLDHQLNRELPVTKETLERLKNCKNAIFPVYGKAVWLSASNENIYVYSYSYHNKLCLLDILPRESYIPGENYDYSFISFCYSAGSKQAFLLYLQDMNSNVDKSSFVLVFDLKKLKIVSLLEMELTMNREPQLKIYPSQDGGKLLVQERFGNRVIFYQIFSLLRTKFLLQDIVKRFLWKHFSKDDVLNSILPNHLIEEVLDGY